MLCFAYFRFLMARFCKDLNCVPVLAGIFRSLSCVFPTLHLAPRLCFAYYRSVMARCFRGFDLVPQTAI